MKSGGKATQRGPASPKDKSKLQRDPPSQFRSPDIDLTDLRNTRNGLIVYTLDPTKYPRNVVSFNDDWVLIKDLYPKSTVHLLLIPRNPSISALHPYEALQNSEILNSAKPEVEKAKGIVASELRRLHGAFSASEKSRREAMESDDPPDELPPGRDWSREVMAGIHTHPSMNHLHIHILSVDRFSECLKHSKHYNSFSTDFFVPVDAFPLSDSERNRRYNLRWHEMDMVCWRCGRNFYRRFKQLKSHLEEEFRAWRLE